MWSAGLVSRDSFFLDRSGQFQRGMSDMGSDWVTGLCVIKATATP